MNTCNTNLSVISIVLDDYGHFNQKISTSNSLLFIISSRSFPGKDKYSRRKKSQLFSSFAFGEEKSKNETDGCV